MKIAGPLRMQAPGGDENNLVHSEGFRVYKVPIREVKTEILGIAPLSYSNTEPHLAPLRNMELCHDK